MHIRLQRSQSGRDLAQQGLEVSNLLHLHPQDIERSVMILIHSVSLSIE